LREELKYLDIKKLLETDNKNKEWTRYDKKLAKLFDDSKAPSKARLDKRQQLLGLCDLLYKVLPTRKCWKSERTLAKELGESKRQIAYAKRILQLTGHIKIVEVDNKNYLNKAHHIYKINPRRITPAVPDANLNFLCRYTPAELMELSKLEMLEILDEANLYYIPLYYPQQLGNGKVVCSCRQKYCRFIGKHPVIRYATRDFTNPSVRKRIRRRWQVEDENYNIGILTKNFAVLDVDFRNHGHHSFVLLQEDYGNISFDIVVKTGNGFHCYLPHRLKGQTNILGYKGIDIKSHGGYVVGPQSIHKSGEMYEWLSLEKPAPLNEDLLSALGKGHTKKIKDQDLKEKSSVISLRNDSEIIEEGCRNDTLFRQGIYLHHHSTPFEKLVEKLKTINQTRCKKPLPEHEVLTIANSISRYEVGRMPQSKDMGLLP
jgi:hypothetical protein